MKQKILAFILGLMMLTSGSGLIYAQATTSVDNTFEFGVVNISLDEYQIQNNKEVPYPDKPINIIPGMVISKIPRIHNDGADCYIRAKITFKNTDMIDTSDLTISKNWKQADDGYWYYTKILPAEKDVDLFSTVNIPSDFPESEIDKKIQLAIQIDAIQAKNFTPNFNRAKPWGNVKVIAYKGDENYEYSQFKQSDDQLFTVTYQGDSGKLVTNSKDFFENMPFLMPGDSYSDELTIQNNGKNPIKLYFSTAYDQEELNLLEKIDLTITKTVNGQTSTIYEGNLAAADLNKSVLIDTFDANEKGTMSFTVSVPAELTNEYALKDSAVTWIFSTDEIIPDKPEDKPDKPDSKPDNPDSTPDNPDKGSNNGSPQTGDTNMVTILFTIFISSAAGLLLTITFPLWKKKKEAGTHETE